jgi:hypothetical protein
MQVELRRRVDELGLDADELVFDADEDDLPCRLSQTPVQAVNRVEVLAVTPFAGDALTLRGILRESNWSFHLADFLLRSSAPASPDAPGRGSL